MIEDPATLTARVEAQETPPGAADEDEGLPRATGAALYAFCLVFGIGLLPGPFATLIIWRVRRDEPFVDWHGRQALDLALTALAGGLLWSAGRVLQPTQGAAGSVMQWLGLAVIAIQVAQGLWALVDAARGGAKRMMFSFHVLRRGGTWATGPAMA